MTIPKSSYYDVESGTERLWTHDDKCDCPPCSKSRLKAALDSIIKSRMAFAPTAKKKDKLGKTKFSGSFTSSSSKSMHDWFGGIIDDVFRPGTEFVWDTSKDEGKCFGWNPEADYTYTQKDIYMHLSDKPMSPDMTMDDMAIMSVDQSKAVLTLKVLYNPFFNQRLKERIESKYRNWNPTNKCWELHPSKMKDVQQICREFYKGVQIIGQKPVLGTKFEKLLSHLTKEDKASIYRLMALKYHPDKGGSHEVMSLLNEVFKQ